MSEPTSSKESQLHRTIRLLKRLKDSTELLNFHATENGWDDLFVLKELCDGGFITGNKMDNGSGLCAHMTMVRITTIGEIRLQELEDNEQNRMAMPIEIENLKAKIKQMESERKTLFGYFKLAGWGERFAMVGMLGLVFTGGFGAAQIPTIRDVMALIKDFKP